jgi:hypothetical protein
VTEAPFDLLAQPDHRLRLTSGAESPFEDPVKAAV